MNSINTKANELEQYVETTNKEVENKKTNLNELKNKYEQVNASETATEEEKTTAKNNYDTALKEYNDYVSNANQKAQTLKTELYALVPDYTNSWQTTTNTSNNVKLDFKNYSGTAYFILWVKIENGTNTYYDFMGYSSEIKEKQTTEEPSDDWTDFSNAKYELMKNGTSKALVEISEVNYKEDSSYYLYITSSNTKPDISSIALSERIYVLKSKKN